MAVLQLGYTNDDPRKIEKTFTLTHNLTVQVKDNCSIESPIFILDYDSSYASCNYCYYPDFKRYYYIEDIVMAPGGKAQIVCASDPLMSFKTAILNLTCFISRISDAEKRAAYVNDPSFPITAESYAKPYPFGGGADFGVNFDNQYMLTVIGGTHTE